jgi:hypothetical protein
VQAPRHLVGVRVELATRMKLGHHDLGRRLLLLLVVIDGNAAAVVDDCDGIVEVDEDLDRVAEAGQGFVDRVVHDLVDEVVETHVARRADVHGRTLANGLAAFKNRN